jgi:hypothetical protein
MTLGTSVKAIYFFDNKFAMAVGATVPPLLDEEWDDVDIDITIDSALLKEDFHYDQDDDSSSSAKEKEVVDDPPCDYMEEL